MALSYIPMAFKSAHKGTHRGTPKGAPAQGRMPNRKPSRDGQTLTHPSLDTLRQGTLQEGDLGFRVQGLGFRVLGFIGFRVFGFFRVQ